MPGPGDNSTLAVWETEPEPHPLDEQVRVMAALRESLTYVKPIQLKVITLRNAEYEKVLVLFCSGDEVPQTLLSQSWQLMAEAFALLPVQPRVQELDDMEDGTARKALCIESQPSLACHLGNKRDGWQPVRTARIVLQETCPTRPMAKALDSAVEAWGLHTNSKQRKFMAQLAWALVLNPDASDPPNTYNGNAWAMLREAIGRSDPVDVQPQLQLTAQGEDAGGAQPPLLTSALLSDWRRLRRGPARRGAQHQEEPETEWRAEGAGDDDEGAGARAHLQSMADMGGGVADADTRPNMRKWQKMTEAEGEDEAQAASRPAHDDDDGWGPEWRAEGAPGHKTPTPKWGNRRKSEVRKTPTPKISKISYHTWAVAKKAAKAKEMMRR